MPARLRWFYSRKSCRTCQKAQAFLDAAGVTPREVVNGLKVKFGPEETLAVAAGVRWVCVLARGEVVMTATATATREELLSLLLGRSGTLRAPAALIGRQLVVGFHPDGYGEILGVR